MSSLIPCLECEIEKRVNLSLSVPRTLAGEAGASEPRQIGEQKTVHGSRSLLSSAGKQRRGRSAPLPADSMFVVRTSPSFGCAPKASEMSQPLALQAATRS